MITDSFISYGTRLPLGSQEWVEGIWWWHDGNEPDKTQEESEVDPGPDDLEEVVDVEDARI